MKIYRDEKFIGTINLDSKSSKIKKSKKVKFITKDKLRRRLSFWRKVALWQALLFPLAFVITANAAISPESIQIVDRLIRVHDEQHYPPVLEKVAYCETRKNHYNADGTVIRGRIDNDDIGEHQINQRYWGAVAEKLGYDLEDKFDNARMAIYIYNQQGLQPWSASIDAKTLKCKN